MTQCVISRYANYRGGFLHCCKLMLGKFLLPDRWTCMLLSQFESFSSALVFEIKPECEWKKNHSKKCSTTH